LHTMRTNEDEPSTRMFVLRATDYSVVVSVILILEVVVSWSFTKYFCGEVKVSRSSKSTMPTPPPVRVYDRA